MEHHILPINGKKNIDPGTQIGGRDYIEHGEPCRRVMPCDILRPKKGTTLADNYGLVSLQTTLENLKFLLLTDDDGAEA